MTVSKVRQAAWIAFFGSLFVLGLKVWSAHLTGSVALFSDALESVVNVSVALFAMISLWWALKPADENHPYGHGKMEYVAATFEGGLIVVAALWIFSESYQALHEPKELQRLGLGLGVNLAAGVINGALAWFLLRRGKKYASPTLSADGLHLATDFLTTATMLLGIGLMKLTGWQWLDPVLSFALGFFLVFTGVKVVFRSFHSLMDAEDLESLRLFPKILEKRPDWMVDVHGLRVMRSGRFLHVDLHVVVPEFFEMHRAYGLLREWESREARPEWEFHTRLEPCHKHFCSGCVVKDCPVRQEDATSQRRLGLEELRRIDTNLP